MKSKLFIVLAFLPSLLTAQPNQKRFRYYSIYKDYQPLRQFELFASPDGDYKKALELFTTGAIKQNTLQFFYAEALRRRLMEGSPSAEMYIDSLYTTGKLTEENRLYLLAYTALLTSNTDDYELFYKQLRAKFPASLSAPRLPFLFYLKMMDIKSSYKNDSLLSSMKLQFDTILKKQGLSPEYFIFYSLAKIDLDRYNNNEETAIFQFLWNKYPESLDAREIEHRIRDCQTNECKKLKRDILLKRQPEPYSEGFLLDSLHSFADNAQTYTPSANKVASLEKILGNYIRNAKSSLEKETIKSIIKYITLNNEMPASYRYAGGSTVKLPYSANFKNMLKAALPKDSIFKMVSKRAKEFSEVKFTDGEIIEFKKKMNREDLSFFLGLLISMKHIEKRYEFFTWGEPGSDDRENWAAFIAYLRKNPLYYDDERSTWAASNSPYWRYPPLDNYDTLQQANLQIEQLLHQYPGCTSLKKHRLNLLKIQYSLRQREKGLLTLMLSTAVDILDNDQHLLGDNYSFTLFDILKPIGLDYDFKNTKEKVVARYYQQHIPQADRLVIEEKVKALLAKKPYQKNLKTFLKDVLGKTD